MLRAALPPLSTRESWVDFIMIVDPDDGTLFDLTGVSVQIEIRQASPSLAYRYDYSNIPSNYGIYAPVSLLATTDNGKVTIPDTGMIKFAFPESDLRSLCPGQYIVAGTMARDDETLQLFLLDMSILDGVVPQ